MSLSRRPQLSATTKAFVGNSFVYLLGSTLAKLVGFILLPIYTAKISPADFGYYDLSITYVTVAATALFFDMWISTMRFMYDSENDSHKAKVVRSGITLFLLSSALYLSLALIVSLFIDVRYLGLIVLYGLTSNFANMYGFIARGYGKNKSFAMSGILAAAIAGGTSAIMLLVLNMDFSALYIAAILGFLGQAIYLECSTNTRRSLFKYKLDRQLTRDMLIHMLPLVVNSSAFWLLTGYNRVIISTEMPLSENGIYAIAARFVLVVTLITAVFNFAWQDTLFKKAAENQLKKFYSPSSNLYILMLLVGGAVLLPAIWLGFDIVVSSQYQPAKDIIPLLIVSALLSAYIAFQGSLFHSLKHTKAIFYSMITACAINVALCLPLIREFGLNGASLATTIGFLVCIIIRAVMLSKKLPYHFDFTILAAVALFGLSIWAYLNGGALVNGIAFFVISIFSLMLVGVSYNKHSKRKAT